MASIDIGAKMLREIAPSDSHTWYSSKFNPMYATTAAGQNLFHFALQATFIRDGHGVGILTNWDNPMRFVRRQDFVDMSDIKVGIGLSGGSVFSVRFSLPSRIIILFVM